MSGKCGPVRQEFLSEEDLDLQNLSWEELIAVWNQWLLQAQSTNDEDKDSYEHGVFQNVKVESGEAGKRGAGSGERGAGSGERGAWSGERGAGSVERGAGSVERGAGSGERGRVKSEE
ncbi:hypothetical protein [Haloferula sp. A504]|uniref:hypothetical protein n=1 Tax=Haloferula sp. A504 TaxID=3373601 RepID=UPI0031CBFDF2|nr:hypothetical protein [Verrucomicrobiaceae bacterium E54]